MRNVKYTHIRKRMNKAFKATLAKILIFYLLISGFIKASDHYSYITCSLKSNSNFELALLAQNAIDQCDAANKNCSEKAIDLIGLSINWDDRINISDHIAVCTIVYIGSFNIDRRIRVHPYAHHMTDDQKRILIMHEIMHCLLDYDHAEDEANAMNPYIPSQENIDLLGGPDIIINNAFENNNMHGGSNARQFD